MGLAFDFIIDMIKDLTSFLERIIFSYNGIYVSFWGIIVGGLITSMIISIFWKGARG